MMYCENSYTAACDFKQNIFLAPLYIRLSRNLAIALTVGLLKRNEGKLTINSG